MEINNLKELGERGTLVLRDLVKFYVEGEVIEYRVEQNSYGSFLDKIFATLDDIHHPNEIIFDVLNLDKRKFCFEHYGYEANKRGDWPNSRKDDFEALTRVTKHLYMIIEGVKGIEEVEEDKIKTSRFSLIDFD